MTKQINAVIIGASGYTGAELIRLLFNHPNVEISALVANSKAGQPIRDIYPHLANVDLPDLVTDKVDFTDVDVAFCCLPHATSQEMISELPSHLKIIDLSADFRLRNPDAYQEWYGKEHVALEQQHEAVYGLSEVYRDQIKEKRIVACPGCYPTSMLLPLIPLFKAKAITSEHIVIDSKSGITGAGRSAKIANLFTEMNDNIKAYGIGGHRHIAEVEQELSLFSGKHVTATFTPQVVPMNRGILSNIYVSIADGKTIDDVKSALEDFYADEHFVKVFTNGYAPTTRDVTGSNQCFIGVFADRVPGRAIIVSVIDNLLKGASGQAVQNMNIVYDLPEDAGLSKISMFP
jgi:N-acetyl-gamma-glutamyl-phosphate reductase